MQNGGEQVARVPPAATAAPPMPERLSFNLLLQELHITNSRENRLAGKRSSRKQDCAASNDPKAPH